MIYGVQRFSRPLHKKRGYAATIILSFLLVGMIYFGIVKMLDNWDNDWVEMHKITVKGE